MRQSGVTDVDHVTIGDIYSDEDLDQLVARFM